eukprot:scaffold49588_cov46-Phaeocystis_antarctica.AAC.1
MGAAMAATVAWLAAAATAAAEGWATAAKGWAAATAATAVTAAAAAAAKGWAEAATATARSAEAASDRRTSSNDYTVRRSTCQPNQPLSSSRRRTHNSYWARVRSSWYTIAGCWTGSTPTCPQLRHRCRRSTPYCHSKR